MSALDPDCCEPHDGHVHGYPEAGQQRFICRACGTDLGRMPDQAAARVLIARHRRDVHGLPDIPGVRDA